MDMIESVVDNFMKLTKVPRPSHHEKKISDFFVEWAKEHGFDPVQNEVYNVMFDVPATKGMEDYPLCILQGHMDMVVAVEKGKIFDPENDPISVIRDQKANTLRADGTSLGGDDGSGCAIIMSIAEGKMAHGPLRVLFTADEEDGMDGTFSVDASSLKEAKYLINLDSEVSDEVLVSTAAGDAVCVSGSVSRKEAAFDLSLNLELSGLKGGHSGMEINKGRMNGIIGLSRFLKELQKEGLPFELSSFAGGTAGNAIPNDVNCRIVISRKDYERFQSILDAWTEEQKKVYEGIEEGITCKVTEESSLPKVIPEEEKQNAIRFMTGVIDGVYSWSSDMEGLVESSSNLGIFKLDENGVTANANVRSSRAEKQEEMLKHQLELGEACGYKAERVKMADPWFYDPDSHLLQLTKEIYKKQNGEEIKVVALHAGLECGTFKLLNPDLDMISIGPDIEGAHTIHETLYLDSVAKTWNLIEGLLRAIGEQK